MFCYVMFYVMLCYVMFYVMLCYVMLCYVMFSLVLSVFLSLSRSRSLSPFLILPVTILKQTITKIHATIQGCEEETKKLTAP